MNQNERLEYLLQKFKEDSIQYKNLEIKGNYDEKRMVLRSLMNIRMPKKMSKEVINVQDEFLTEEAENKGIVQLSNIPTVEKQYGSKHPYADKLSIWQGDITRLKVGAIVNAANSQMLGCFIPCHRCIDNAIHSAAGIELRAECHSMMNRKRTQFGLEYEEPTGAAMLTKGYNLPAQYVIHTVGPILEEKVTDDLCYALQNCYESVLKCCMENGIRSVAFCCISTGEFKFPNDIAARIAVETVTHFLQEHSESFERVIFNVFKDLDKKYYEQELVDGKKYLDGYK